MEEIKAWQSRPLEQMYPVIFFDALWVKIREDGVVRNKAIYLALGVLPCGTREVLGLWIESTEGAKFWLKVFNDLKTRGTNDILIAVTDGLSGIGDALAAVFPATTLQTCIVHLIRNSLNYAGWKDRPALAKALRPIYQALNADTAATELDAFEGSALGRKLPMVVARMAACLGSGDSVLRLRSRSAPADLHDQRNREPARGPAQDHQIARSFPQRRRRYQTDLAGIAQHHGRRSKPKHSWMVRRNERACNRLRRSIHTNQRLLTCHHRLAHRVGRPVRRKRRPTAAVDKSLQRLIHKKTDTPSEHAFHSSFALCRGVALNTEDTETQRTQRKR
jgi:hypothetical protein